MRSLKEELFDIFRLKLRDVVLSDLTQNKYGESA